MTKEEIKNLRELIDLMLDKCILADSRTKVFKRLEEVCDLAIKELEQESCCDAISRAEAIKRFTYNYKGEHISDYDCDNFPVQIDIKTVKKILRDLPPVTSQPRKGHWIECMPGGAEEWCYKCSECNFWKYKKTINLSKFSFCPNCGIKMQKESEV